jgi:transposase
VLVREMRAKVRLCKDLLDERGGWQQRIAAVLYHHGAPPRPGLVHGERQWLDAEQALSPSGRQAITVAWRIIDALDTEVLRLRAELTGFARRQAGCRQLHREYGIGPLISVVVWSELGDTCRFHASGNAVRHTGLDISVYSCDGKRSRGHLTRQGPGLLRWALYEAAFCACRSGSPDHAYYQRVADRLGSRRAIISVARKLARRCHHRLRALGEEAFTTA